MHITETTDSSRSGPFSTTWEIKAAAGDAEEVINWLRRPVEGAMAIDIGRILRTRTRAERLLLAIGIELGSDLRAPLTLAAARLDALAALRARRYEYLATCIESANATDVAYMIMHQLEPNHADVFDALCRLKLALAPLETNPVITATLSPALVARPATEPDPQEVFDEIMAALEEGNLTGLALHRLKRPQSMDEVYCFAKTLKPKAVAALGAGLRARLGLDRCRHCEEPLGTVHSKECATRFYDGAGSGEDVVTAAWCAGGTAGCDPVPEGDGEKMTPHEGVEPTV